MAIDRQFEAMLDRLLAALPCFQQAFETAISPMLPETFVLAKNYFKSFPQHGFLASNALQEKERYLLSPTCCYPVFHAMMDTKLEGETLITHKNICFRCEEYYESGERQITFLMREYVFFSESLDVINDWIDRVKQEVSLMITELGLDVKIEKATDPFFNINDFKLKFQESQNLKSEFIIDQIACGSVNLHLKAFSKACNIHSATDKQVYSACFGLGYDRIYQKYVEQQLRVSK